MLVRHIARAYSQTAVQHIRVRKPFNLVVVLPTFSFSVEVDVLSVTNTCYGIDLISFCCTAFSGCLEVLFFVFWFGMRGSDPKNYSGSFDNISYTTPVVAPNKRRIESIQPGPRLGLASSPTACLLQIQATGFLRMGPRLIFRTCVRSLRFVHLPSGLRTVEPCLLKLMLAPYPSHTHRSRNTGTAATNATRHSAAIAACIGRYMCHNRSAVRISNQHQLMKARTADVIASFR